MDHDVADFNIWINNLSPAVTAALCAHMTDATTTRTGIPDIIITDAAQTEAPCRAVPALPLYIGRRLRIGTVIRQALQMAADSALYLDPFPLAGGIFAPAEKTLTLATGEAVNLTDRETDIIVFLARHQGRAVPRDVLLKRIFRYQQQVDTHTLETHIYRLRQKLEAAGDILKTDQSGGYQLDDTGAVT